MASIEADCETMTHTRKQRLAVQLNNCHLQVTYRRAANSWKGAVASVFTRNAFSVEIASLFCWANRSCFSDRFR